MKNKWKLFNIVNLSKCGLTTREVRKAAKICHNSQVNSLLRELAKEGLIIRVKPIKGVIMNYSLLSIDNEKVKRNTNKQIQLISNFFNKGSRDRILTNAFTGEEITYNILGVGAIVAARSGKQIENNNDLCKFYQFYDEGWRTLLAAEIFSSGKSYVDIIEEKVDRYHEELVRNYVPYF